MKSTLKIGLLVLAGVLAGCYQYVNIPGETGDVAMHSVNASHVANAEYEALRAVVVGGRFMGQYRVVLPKGTLPATYDTVCGKLGPAASWSEAESQPSLPTLEVRHVYIRGLDGTVDVIRPSDATELSGPRQLVSVYMELYPVGGWGTKRVRPWRMSLDDALIRSQYETQGSP